MNPFVLMGILILMMFAAASGNSSLNLINSGVIGTALVIVALFLYFLPTYLAYKHEHHNTVAIFALNLLLGWTVLGWIAALVWALTRPPNAAA